MATEIDYSAIDDRVLNSEDKLDVLEELTTVERKADKIGLALGLSAGNYEPTMSSVVDVWLNQDYNTKRHGMPSYRGLVKAVARKVGGSNPALAKKISDSHKAQAQHGSGAVASDDSSQQTAASLPTPTVPSHVTETEGVGDLFQKLLPRKPKDLPANFRPYPMNGSPHGLCLIINNINFRGKQPRVGSDVDEHSLSKLFPTLGYQLHGEKVHRDCTAKEIMSLVKNVACVDHSRYDSVVLFIASHGMAGYVYGNDDRLVSLEEIQLALTDCETLAGKPKMIFIQACRGSKLPDGRVVQNDGDDDDNLFIPRDCDFFFGYATTPDTKACRFTDIGSWYVIELCKIMKNYHKYLDLHSMVTAVHYELATNKEYLFEFTEITGKKKAYKQCAQLVSTLTRPVFFKLEC